jgi:hypothetical protein
MTAHIPDGASAWLIDAANMMPPRDPDNDDENEQDEKESDDEPAVIREPDE